MAEHVLKTVGYVWDAIEAGKKPWEARRNDRGFQPGDNVVLQKLDDDNISLALRDEPVKVGGGDVCWTFDLTFKIGWMLQGGQFGIEPGYCVFSLEPTDTSRPVK